MGGDRFRREDRSVWVRAVDVMRPRQNVWQILIAINLDKGANQDFIGQNDLALAA